MRKNVASQVVGVQMCSATDGSAFTGSVTVYVTGDGGTQAVGSVGAGACTHEGNGFHTYAPAQAETNYDHVAFTFIGTGAIPSTVQIYTTFPQTGDNFSRLGAPAGASVSADIAAVKTQTAAIEVDTQDIQGRLPAALVGGRIDANAGAISGDATAADNLEAALDGTGGVTITADLTGNITGNLSGSVGSVTGAVGSVTGAVGSVTGNVGGNVTGSVGSVGAGGIAAASFAAGAIDAAAIANGAIDRAAFAADTGLQSVRSNTAQAGAATTITLDASASATDDIYNNHLIYLTGGTGAGQARYITDYNGTTKVATVATWTTNPDNTSTFAILPGDAIPGASAPTAAQVADAVWDELLSGHAISGSTGEALSAAGGAGDPWITALPGSYSAGQAGYIIGTNLNATVSSRASQTSVDTVDDFLDTEIAAIKAKTDNLPADPADASDIASSFTTVNGKLDTIDDFLDTEVAAIKAKTDLIPAAPAAVGDIPTAGAIADAVWDEATSGHVSAGTTGLALVNTDLRGSRTVIRGTAASGTTTTLTPSALSPSGSDADQFKGRILVFDNDTTTAALRGQATDITASSGVALAVLTFTALTTAPASGDTFSIV